ncbi:hypothetical protein [Bacillus sp. NPDC077027]|uniref:hypothetical protein n=1 Tax=Bacillus sp. NPDC077027 TaxID=3390548 RepID=UPI003D023BD7
MKVTIVGEMNVDLLAKKLLEVVENTAIKVQTEAEDAKINSWSITEADVLVKFNIDGVDEPQFLTVEHHKGHPELLHWVADVSKDELSSNEDESMFDEWTVSKSQGQDLQFKEVKSVYNADDFTGVESSEDFGDMQKDVINHKDGFKVVQVFQNDKLIQEYKLIPTE